MNDYNFIGKSQTDTLRELITVHRKFHEELDVITASNNDPNFIEPLIDLRNFNISCTNHYSAMLIKSKYDLMPQCDISKMRSLAITEEETMWKIHFELSLLVQVYRKAIKNADVSDFNKKIIAMNLDEIIERKDDILHPIRKSVA
jgi:hypothetical protein